MAEVSQDWARSLQRRIAAMHALWQRGVADLTLAQVNHQERPGVLPIAFSLLHFVLYGEDHRISSLILGEPTLWEAGGWAERVGVAGLTIQGVRRGLPLVEAEQLRLGDLDAWRAYQAAEFARTEAVLGALPLSRYAEVLYGGEMPEHARGSYLALLVGPEGPIRLIDALEANIYQHGIRHVGEIEHARALVGLGGLT